MPEDRRGSKDPGKKNAVEIWKRLNLYHIPTARRRRSHELRDQYENIHRQEDAYRTFLLC
jgi:hypothetical protein